MYNQEEEEHSKETVGEYVSRMSRRRSGEEE
jgi:hypothetical protein